MFRSKGQATNPKTASAKLVQDSEHKSAQEPVQEPVQEPDHTAAEKARLDQWIVAAISGDVDAFGMLYGTYADNVYRYFFYRVRLDAEAQDLTAQVFLNAWKAIGRYQYGEIPFLVWLYTISRNLLINYQRGQRQYTTVAILGEGVAEQVADQTEETNPVSAMLRRADNQELVQAFEQLNEEQQQVIYYRFVENWDHAEVARVMRKSEGAVRAIQFRALQSLRRLLSQTREGGK